MFNTIENMASFIQHSQWGDACGRRVCFGSNISAIMCDQPEGYAFEPHKHEHEQLTIILSGALEYTIDGETRVMRTGDTAYLPPFAVHSAVTIEPCRFIDVFSPVRLDQMAWFDSSIKAEPVTTKAEQPK